MVKNRNLNIYFESNNGLFRSVKLTKNSDPDKHIACGIGFISCSEFLFTHGGMRKNLIIFGADISSSVHMGNKNKVS